jgi:hypothetical protein
VAIYLYVQIICLFQIQLVSFDTLHNLIQPGSIQQWRHKLADTIETDLIFGREEVFGEALETRQP